MCLPPFQASDPELRDLKVEEVTDEGEPLWTWGRWGASGLPPSESSEEEGGHCYGLEEVGVGHVFLRPARGEEGDRTMPNSLVGFIDQ